MNMAANFSFLHHHHQCYLHSKFTTTHQERSTIISVSCMGHRRHHHDVREAANHQDSSLKLQEEREREKEKEQEMTSSKGRQRILNGLEISKLGMALRESLSPQRKGDWKDVSLMSLSFAVYVYISQKIVCAYYAYWLSVPKQPW